jgi:UPF0755 protein
MLETGSPYSTTSRVSRHRRPSRWIRIGLTLVLVAGLLVVLGVRYYVWCNGASGSRTPLSFTVEEGASGEEVVNSLHDRGVLRCATVSRWLLARSGKADEVRAGTYDLTTNMTPSEAFDVITKAPPPAPTVSLTIPEGYRLTQIAERVHDVIGIPVERFLDAADRHRARPPYLPVDKPLEGFLFPQTYEFLAHGTSPGQVIDRLLQEFATEAGSLPWQNAEALGVSPYEVVIIASMIEREARVPEDRPLISAVIYNRLNQGMRLEIDATVAYIDPDPANGLTVSDFQIHSPYNTRLHTGLPPTPIASPGLASLRAALEPADVDYLFYVLCGTDGHHVFSTSYDRFLKDKARCLG